MVYNRLLLMLPKLIANYNMQSDQEKWSPSHVRACVAPHRSVARVGRSALLQNPHLQNHQGHTHVQHLQSESDFPSGSRVADPLPDAQTLILSETAQAVEFGSGADAEPAPATSLNTEKSSSSSDNPLLPHNYNGASRTLGVLGARDQPGAPLDMGAPQTRPGAPQQAALQRSSARTPAQYYTDACRGGMDPWSMPQRLLVPVQSLSVPSWGQQISGDYAAPAMAMGGRWESEQHTSTGNIQSHQGTGASAGFISPVQLQSAVASAGHSQSPAEPIGPSAFAPTLGTLANKLAASKPRENLLVPPYRRCSSFRPDGFAPPDRLTDAPKTKRLSSPPAADPHSFVSQKKHAHIRRIFQVYGFTTAVYFTPSKFCCNNRD